MADCPKCSKHLRLIDWKQRCPHCGANIVLYDLQERLMQDADKAEVQHYHFQKRMDRLRMAFVGSKLAIVRIFTSLIPILAILLPLVNVSIGAPLKEYSGNISAITLYQLADDIDFDLILQLFGDEASKIPLLCVFISAGAILLSALVLLIRFICLTMACSPKGKIRNYIFDTILLMLALCSIISFSCIPENSLITGSLHVGAFVFLALIILNFVIDILIFRENLEITHAQVYVGGIPIEEYFQMVDSGVPQQEIRAEMYARLTKLQEEKDAKLREEAEKNEAKEKEKEKEEASV